MGANAQTSVPAFTTGQVLTAQQQTEINTGVPVFATTTTRDAAFGGSGEKVLAEGQLAYIEASNIVQYYDGSTWQTLAPQTFSSGLNYITGASFSAASEFVVDSCFTSTYANYKIIIDYDGSVATATQLRGQFRTGGSNNTTTNYGYLLNISTEANTNAISWQGFGSVNIFICGYVMNNYGQVTIELTNPQTAQETRFTSVGMAFGGTNSYLTTIGGAFDATTSFDGIRIFPNSGTFTGNYRIYGYQNS